MSLKLYPLQKLTRHVLTAAALLTSTSAFAQYCTPSWYINGCDDGDDINTFILPGAASTGINDVNTGCPGGTAGYEDRTSTNVSLQQAVTYTAQINSSDPYELEDETVEVFIDFNNDFTFDPTTESVGGLEGIGASLSSFSITIPNGATLGTHRMRVALNYGAFYPGVTPCPDVANFDRYGEVHDYTVTILSAPACTAPSGVSVTPASGGGTANWTASASNPSLGYVWRVFPTGSGPQGTPAAFGTTAAGVTTASFSGLTGSTYTFFVAARCGTTDTSAFASTASFLLNDNAAGASLLTVGTACSGAANGTLVGATVQTGEPSISCEGSSGENATVWYKFVAPASGMVRISSDYNNLTGTQLTDSKIGVYQVGNVSDFSTYQLIGCDEDNGVLNSGYRSIVYMTGLADGATYYIKVDKYSSFDASGVFCIDVMPLDATMLADQANCGGSSFYNFTGESSANTSLVDNITGKLVANINANGNALDGVNVEFYQNTGAARQATGGQYYLNRNYTFNVGTQPTSPVTVQLFFSDADYTSLTTAAPSVNMSNLQVTHISSNTCDMTYNTTTSGQLLPVTGTGNANGVRSVTFQTPSFSSFFIHEGASPLAVEILDITAANQGAKNRVDWKVGKQDKGDVFAIERSTDAEHFTQIGTIEVGNSNSYTYWDERPVTGVNYYRLRVVDVNGNATYTKVVSATVKAGGAFAIEAYPNPATEMVTVRTYGASATATLQLTDLTGKVVRTIAMNGDKVDVNLNGLASGIYLLKYTADGHMETMRITKQ